MAIRKRDSEILSELRKPQEDSEISNQKDLPELQRLPGLKLTGQALADLLMVFEFLHNFGETLGFGKSTFVKAKHYYIYLFVGFVFLKIWNHCQHYKISIWLCAMMALLLMPKKNYYL